MIQVALYPAKLYHVPVLNQLQKKQLNVYVIGICTV
jgi:hypothetical protein